VCGELLLVALLVEDDGLDDLGQWRAQRIRNQAARKCRSFLGVGFALEGWPSTLT
jgi:hypothetical protein